jgi:hypothetical protein
MQVLGAKKTNSNVFFCLQSDYLLIWTICIGE